MPTHTCLQRCPRGLCRVPCERDRQGISQSNNKREIYLIPGSQCLSAQCIYCQSVRAKNTSRQRAHLLECPNYLNAMKEHNPQSSILELAANGTPTPAMKPQKKRDLETMVNGFPGDTGLVTRGPPVPRPTSVHAMLSRIIAYFAVVLNATFSLLFSSTPRSQ